MSNLKQLPILGKTIASIVNDESNEVYFHCTDGTHYRMYHSQDCCEDVSLEEIHGDLKNLVDSPLLQAEVISSESQAEAMAEIDKPLAVKIALTQKTKADPDGWGPEESKTWTFYKFATIKGSVTLRWYGSSNGYYSERVDFEEFTPRKLGHPMLQK